MGAARFHTEGEYKFKRSIKRLDLRKGDGVSSFISTTSTEKFEADLFDISPFGASVKINKNFIQTSLGDSINFEIKFHDKKIVSYLCEIIWKKNEGQNTKIGLIFREQVRPMPSVVPLGNASFPVTVPKYFHFTAVVYKPYLFFERSLISITQFSSQVWQCEFFDSEMILFKGMHLDLWILNFERERNKIAAEVVFFEAGSEGKLLVQIKILRIGKNISKWIAHQLVLNCNFSPLQIRKLGFETKDFSNGFVLSGQPPHKIGWSLSQRSV